MAVAFSWKGFVDTDLQFSEFVAGNHTLACRFMMQYPNAYEGPMIAENGTGMFMLGQGDYGQAGPINEGRKILLAVGTQSRLFAVPALKSGIWGHLAAVATRTPDKWTYTVYLDGNILGSLAVPAGDTDLPSGTLRFGRRTTGKLVKQHEAQFYGLVDDVAVFTRAMSQDEIRNLCNNVKNLTGNETGLLAGYTFAEAPTHPRLSRPITLKGAAHRVSATIDRNSSVDAALLALPTQHQHVDLPFKTGDVWRVVQGHDHPPGHHSGYACFTFDFIIDAEQVAGAPYPAGTAGAPLQAAAAGKAVRVRESEPTGTAVPNILEVEHTQGECSQYLHLGQNSIPVNEGSAVLKGQHIAIASSTGMEGQPNANHLHFGVLNGFKDAPGFVTFPVAFSDYQVKNGSGWINISRGIPTVDQVLRISAGAVFRPQRFGPGARSREIEQSRRRCYRCYGASLDRTMAAGPLPQLGPVEAGAAKSGGQHSGGGCLTARKSSTFSLTGGV